MLLRLPKLRNVQFSHYHQNVPIQLLVLLFELEVLLLLGFQLASLQPNRGPELFVLRLALVSCQLEALRRALELLPHAGHLFVLASEGSL